MTRKYFGYCEVRKTPVRPFLSDSKDTLGVFKTNKNLLNNVMSDTIILFRKVDAKIIKNEKGVI